MKLCQRHNGEHGLVEMARTLCLRNGEVTWGREGHSGTSSDVWINPSCPEGGKVLGIYHCVPGEAIVYIPGKGSLLAKDAAEYAFAKHQSPELINIKTGLGGEISVTPNHPLLTPDGWTLAGLISQGDKLLLETSLPCLANGHISITEWKPRNHWQVKHNPDLPSELTEDLGLLLGLLWSDGTLTKKGISLTNSDTALLDRFRWLVDSLFSLATRRYKIPGAWVAWVDVLFSAKVAHFISNDLGFRKDRVPDCLWSASEPVRRAFLEGVVLGDGSTSPTNPGKPNDLVTSIAIGTSYSASISLAYFLSTLGIKPRIRQHKQNWEARKSDFIYQVAYQSGNHQLQSVVPVKYNKEHRDAKTGRFLKGHHGGCQFTGGKTIGNEVKVLNVEHRFGDFEVYDFHMPDYDNLLYTGSLPFISHNTHPGGTTEPSPQDLKAMAKAGLQYMCISDDYETRCRRVI